MKNTDNHLHYMIDDKRGSSIGIDHQETKIEYATLNRRMNAIAIDGFLLFIVFTPLVQLLYMITGISGILAHFMLERSLGLHAGFFDIFPYLTMHQALGKFLAIQIGNALLCSAYIVSFWCWKGQTIGGMLARCKVVRDEDMGSLTVGLSISRFFAAFLSVLPVSLGMLMIGFTKKHQALHDKIVGTLVIVARKRNK